MRRWHGFIKGREHGANSRGHRALSPWPLALLWVGLWGVSMASAQRPGPGPVPKAEEDPVMARWERRVVEKTLPNGFKLLVLPRGYVPVVAFHNYVDAGSVHESLGESGLAHLFEHMAFKGTSTIGTSDWAKEKEALDKMEQAHACYLQEKWKGEQADRDRMQACWDEFKRWEAEAQKYVVTDEFGQIVERNGGRRLNAFTTADSTEYFFGLPSNRAELWFYLESARFRDPVFREFYKERDVVLEEYRLRVENNPIGRMFHRLVGVAFLAHPYGRPVIGFPSDLENIDISRALQFYQAYYRPNSMVAAAVGLIDPPQAAAWAERYFGDLPPATSRLPVVTQELPFEGERRFTLYLDAQPLLVMAFHVPDFKHPDHWPLEALSYVLARGRSSRLYQRLVLQKKLAAAVNVFTGFPGHKYPHLLVIWVLPNPDVSLDTLENEVLDELASIQKDGIRPDELERFKAQALHDFYKTFEDNGDLARELTFYEKVAGSWRKLFETPRQIQAVTAADVQRVVQTYCVPKRRIVGRLIRADGQAGR